MKNIYILLLLFTTCTTVKSQVVLDNLHNGSQTYEIAGPEYVRMLPGFEYQPQSPNHFRAYIDPNAPAIIPIVYTEGAPVDPDNREINTSFEVGSTPGQASVSLTGGATYSIPIFSPPGTAGMQPSVSLVYNSQSGNGIAGYGWNIAGLSAITRIGHTIYHDAAVKGVDFTDDRFALDGQRLINTIGENGLVGEYGADGTAYYTEVFNGSKIITHGTTGAGPEWFEVIGKDGSTVEYGKVDNSRQTSQRSDQATITWFINKVTDPNGNYIEFLYNKGPVEINLKEIRFTGNTTTNPQIMPYNSIKFYYGERTDKSNAFIAGSRIEQTVLLDHIDIVAENQIIKMYKLKYYFDFYSKLNEVEEYGKDNKRYNSTVFGYGNGTLEHYESRKSFDFEKHQNFFADFDGDGRTDIFRCSPVSNYPNMGSWFVYTIEDNGNFDQAHPFGHGHTGDTVHAITIGDYNGDGYSDVQIYEHYYTTNTNLGYRLRSLYSTGTYMRQDTISLGSTYYKTKILSGDFDGDNKDEILLLQQLDNNNLRARIYKINSGSKSIIFDKMLLPPLESIAKANSYILDFDGDGKDEFLYQEQSSPMPLIGKERIVVYKFLVNPTNNYEILYSEEVRPPHYKEKIFTGDFNGDGNTDILYCLNNAYHQWYVGTSTGQSLLTNAISVDTLNVNPSDTLVQMTVQDFNQDGKTDIAYSVLNPATYLLGMHLLTSTGTNFSINNWGWQLQDTLWLKACGNKTIFIPTETYPVDFNGDGNGDYVFEAFFAYSPSSDIFYDYLYVSHFNPGFDPLTVKKTCNGLNWLSSFNYKPLTSASIYTRSATNIPDCMNIQPAKFVVSSYNTQNGIGGINSKHYKYSGAMYNLTGKGYLGFKGITVIDSLQKIVSNTTFEPDPNYYILKPTLSITKTLSDTILAKSILTNSFKVIFNAPPKVIFPYLSRTLAFDYFTKTRKASTADYDTYANLSSKNDTIYPDFEASAQAEFISSTTFSGFVNGKAWCPAKPSDIVQTMLRTGQPVISTQKHYSYTPQGNINTLTDYYLQDSAVQTTFPLYIAGLPVTTHVHVVNRGNTDDIVQQIAYDNKYRFPLTITDALGFVTTATFDAGFGNKLTQTNANEQTTSFKFDGFGRPLTVTDDLGVWIKTETQWFQNQSMENVLFYTQTTSNNLTSNRNYFDKLGRTLYSSNENNDGSKAIVKTEYNAKGLVTKVSEPCFENSTPTQYTITEYDDFNRPKTLTLPTQAKLQYTYPTPKLPGRTTTVKNSITGITISKTTNATGLLESSTDPGGSIGYAYYSDGQLKSTTTPDGSITSIAYDAYGHQTFLSDLDAGPSTYRYNALGQLQRQTDGKGVTFEMFYDKAGRLIKKAGSNTSGSHSSLINTYNPPTSPKGSRGLPQAEVFVDENGKTVKYSFTYDDKVRLAQKVIESSNRVFAYNYSYDVLGNLTKYTYPSGYSLAFDYNENKGTLKKVIQTSDNKVVYEPGAYNARGQMIDYKVANGSIFTSFEFDDYGMPTFIKTGKNSLGSSEIQKLETNFNKFTGNLEYRKDHNYNVNGNALFEAFTYDEAFKNSLTTWQVENQTQYSMSVEPQTGNILTKSDVTSNGNPYQYSKINAGPHAVTSIVAPLQLPADDLQHVQYNLSNKVKQVSNNLGYMLSIEYGPDEQRIKSEYYIPSGNTSVLAKTKYFVGSDYEVETTPNGGERFLHYLPGGGLYISHPTPGSDSLDYVLTDYQGTWYKVITDNGATVEQYSFDPWGRRRNATDWTFTNVPNTFIFDRGYTGHQMLDAFGLINMNGRVYDPIVARFLSPDNYVQDPQFSHSYNRYSYCFNNPLKYSDPSGMQSKPVYGIYDPQKPASGGGGQSAQVYIDGIRFNNSFGMMDFVSGGSAGGGGLDIENREYAGDLSAYGIHPGDVVINGYVYSGANNFEVRKNLANFGYFGPNTSIEWGQNAICSNIYGTWSRDNKGEWRQTAGVHASNVVASGQEGYDGSTMKPASAYDYSKNVIDGKFSEDWNYIINGSDGNPVSRYANIFKRDWGQASTGDKVNLALAAVPILRFGKLAVPAETFHRFIKPNILNAAGNFEKVVGRNPDIVIDKTQIILRGTGPYRGKTFPTGLDPTDFFP
jgi:RHS repeat-associated protein